MSQQSVTLEVEEYEVEVEVENEWHIIYVDFSISAVLTYQPARISGPPEDCYPDESEIDVVECKLLRAYDEEGKNIPLMQDLREKIDAQIDASDFYDELWEEWESEQDPPDSNE